MNALFEAALEVQKFVQQKNWRFCIIGGLAVIRWGQPRVTQDVDISLLTGFGREEEYVDSLLSVFTGRISDARQFALENRVLLAKASNGILLDIALAGFPYEEQVISRASAFAFAPDVSLVTASAEDLLVLKAFAGRDQDWLDVRGIAERQTDVLDWEYVIRELSRLSELNPETETLQRLREIRRQLETE